MIRAREKELGRKLTRKEKEEIMRQQGHTEEEIARALGLVLA